jgi:hypothetical protein
VEVLAVRLFEGGAQGLDFVAMTFLELVDLTGEGKHDGVVAFGTLVTCWADLVA